MAIAYALISLDEARTYLGVSDSTKAARIQALIEAVSEMVEAYIGNALVKRDFTELKLGGKTGEWFLWRYPVNSIASIVDPDSNTIAAANYHLIAEQGRIIYRYGKFPIARNSTGAEERWTITYNAGRFDATDSVEPRFKEAAKILLGKRYHRPDTGVLSKKVGDLSLTYEASLSFRGDQVLMPAEVIALIGPAVQRNFG